MMKVLSYANPFIVKCADIIFGAFCLDVRTLTSLPTNGFSVLNH